MLHSSTVLTKGKRRREKNKITMKVVADDVTEEGRKKNKKKGGREGEMTRMVCRRKSRRVAAMRMPWMMALIKKQYI